MGPRGRTILAWAAIVALYLLLRVPGLLGNSATYDEPIYIGASKHLSALGDDGAAPMLYHPPLSYHLIDLPLRLLSTPMRPWDPAGPNTQTGLGVLYESSMGGVPVAPSTVLLLARLPILLVGALGLPLMSALARRLGGTSAGWLAAVAWAAFPDAAAQSIQATTDCVAAVAALFLATAALRHVDAVRDGRPSRTTLVTLGVASGLALLAKHTLLMHVAVVAVALFAMRAVTVRRFVAAAAIAGAVVWAGYLFEFHPAVHGDAAHHTLQRVAAALHVDPTTLDRLARTIPIPAPTYFHSVADALFSKAGARAGTIWTAYMDGEWSDRGYWLYFPYAVFFKSPLVLLAACLAGLAGLPATLRAARGPALLVLALFAVPFAGAVASRLNIGFRHLLPILPFLFVVCLAGLARLAAARNWSPLAPAAVAVLLCAEPLASVDDPICFSGMGAARLHARLADSNLEMGQDLERVREWARENGVREISAVLHGPPGLYERECVRDPMFRPFALGPTSTVLRAIRAADQHGPVPPDGLLALGESVLVLPRWRGLLDVAPLAQVHRTRIYALAK